MLIFFNYILYKLIFIQYLYIIVNVIEAADQENLFFRPLDSYGSKMLVNALCNFVTRYQRIYCLQPYSNPRSSPRCLTHDHLLEGLSVGIGDDGGGHSGTVQPKAGADSVLHGENLYS